MTDDIKLLSPNEFPALLQEIPDRPKQLHVRGTLPSSEMKWLAIVGSRACTEYGRRALRYLVEGLRGYPVVIVSGLAYGIDAEAHRAALDTGLTTVAVPGSDWIGTLYPRANVSLARRITGGHRFRRKARHARDRLTFPSATAMAGLCHATLMVEAKEKSGSLTAKLTTEYNRDCSWCRKYF